MQVSIQNHSIGTGRTDAAAETQQVQHAPKTRGAGSPGGDGDNIELSPLMARIRDGVASDGAAQTARVQRLAKLHQAGNYSIDSARLSHALVSHALGAGSTEKS